MAVHTSEAQTDSVSIRAPVAVHTSAQTDSVSIRASVAVHTSEAQTESISMAKVVQETSVQETSVQETPVQETSVQETSVQETSVQETPFQPTPVQETSVQERSFQTTIMEGMYWYVKQKNTGTFINRTYPGNRTVPNLAKTFDEEFSGRNIVIVDVVGNIRSYTLEDLVSVQREFGQARPPNIPKRRTTIATPDEQTSATQPITTETSTTREPRPTLARPKKRRRGIHRPRFGICSVSGYQSSKTIWIIDVLP